VGNLQPQNLTLEPLNHDAHCPEMRPCSISNTLSNTGASPPPSAAATPSASPGSSPPATGTVSCMQALATLMTLLLPVSEARAVIWRMLCLRECVGKLVVELLESL